jgi:hypothetical protein
VKLESRLKKLEQTIRPPQTPRRVIFAWVDEQGRRTKVADSHPHLPDATVYHADLTKRSSNSEL